MLQANVSFRVPANPNPLLARAAWYSVYLDGFGWNSCNIFFFVLLGRYLALSAFFLMIPTVAPDLISCGDYFQCTLRSASIAYRANAQAQDEVRIKSLCGLNTST